MTQFKHAPKEQYTTKVTVLVPLDNDQVDKFSFSVTYKRLDMAQIKALFKRLADSALTGSEEDMDEEIAGEYVLGWNDLPAAEGGFIAFSPETLAEAITIPCYRRAIVRKFMDDLRGPQEAARKN